MTPTRLSQIRASAESCRYPDIRGGVSVSPAEVLEMVDAIVRGSLHGGQANEAPAIPQAEQER